MRMLKRVLLLTIVSEWLRDWDGQREGVAALALDDGDGWVDAWR